MIMPVMQVRPVWMHMLQRGMLMRMRVPAGMWAFRVLMAVMLVRVVVHVLVLLGQVPVSVPVLLLYQHQNGNDE